MRTVGIEPTTKRLRVASECLIELRSQAEIKPLLHLILNSLLLNLEKTG